MQNDRIPLDDEAYGSRLTSPDSIDPAGPAPFPKTLRQPTREFMIALLEDAIHCYQKYAYSGTRRGRRIFREAEAWLTEPDTDACIPFEYVCEVLGMHPDYIRHHLKTWRGKAATGRATSLPRRLVDNSVATKSPKLSTAVVDSPPLRTRHHKTRIVLQHSTDFSE